MLIAFAIIVGLLLLGVLHEQATGPGAVTRLPSGPGDGTPAPDAGPLLPGPHHEHDAVIADACAAEGLSDPFWPVIVKAIITQESGWNPRAGGDRGDSIGLMQVDVAFHPEHTRLELQDPDTNIRAGVRILAECYGAWFEPWVSVRCYNGCVDRIGGQAIDCRDPSGFWGYVRNVQAIALGYAAGSGIEIPALPDGV